MRLAVIAHDTYHLSRSAHYVASALARMSLTEPRRALTDLESATKPTEDSAKAFNDLAQSFSNSRTTYQLPRFDGNPIGQAAKDGQPFQDSRGNWFVRKNGTIRRFTS